MHDLELDSPMLVAQLQSDVPMFTRSVVVGSPLVQRLFWPLDDLTRWVACFLGVPRRMGGGLGLASNAWLAGRGLHNLPNVGAPDGPDSTLSKLPTPDWESESDSVIVGVTASFCPRHGRSCPRPPAASAAAHVACPTIPLCRDADPDVMSAPAVN